MAINLAEKWEKELDKLFTLGSLTDAWCGKDYTFDGVNAIKVRTLDPTPINDYNTATTGVNRFGAYQDVGDTVQTLTLMNKKSFNAVFDAPDVQDTAFIRNAKEYLTQVWDEQMVPLIDEYRFKTWAENAGLSGYNTTKLTTDSVMEAILTGHAAMSNAKVPHTNRVTFISETLWIKARLADALKYNPDWVSKTVVNGVVGTLSGSPIVTVPDSMLPAGVDFMLKYKNATVDAMKLKMLRVIEESENVAGQLMQGLVRYDSFVLDKKASGLYVYGHENICTMPTFSTSSNAVTITKATGETVKYTTDGSNPKTSNTASTYSNAVAITKDTLFRAYAYKTGAVNSGIAEYNAIHT